MHKNLSANSKRKIDFIQRKSAALALPLQALQVRPYRMVCKRFQELFSSWADSSSSWLSLESSSIHHHYHSLRFPPRHFISVEISESMDRSALVVPSWVITFVFAKQSMRLLWILKQKKAKHVARTIDILKKVAPDLPEGKTCEKEDLCRDIVKQLGKREQKWAVAR